MEPTAREILGRPLMMREIAQQICDEHGLTLRFLTGSSRKRSVAWARQEAFRRCYAEGYSSIQIARFFDRDHTTVLYGKRVAAERREISPRSPLIPATQQVAFSDKRGIVHNNPGCESQRSS